MTAMITPQRLKELLSYDPNTGHFTWITNVGQRGKPGLVAGTPVRGYISIGIDKRYYRAHRLAFLYMNGSWPKFVDHIDGNRSNNIWSNLRECNEWHENYQNLSIRSTNSTGYMGVSELRGKYQANICHKGKLLYLGLFDTPQAAHQAYLDKKKQLHTFNPVPR